MRLPEVVRARAANAPSTADLRAFGAQLRGPHRASACRAVLDGARVALVLKRRGVRPLLAGGGSSSGARRDTDRTRAVSASVDAGLGLLPIAPTCLRRSVTLLRELRRLGLDASLHVGVRTADHVVEAHAWVQVADLVVNDDPGLVSTYGELTDGGPGDLLELLA